MDDIIYISSEKKEEARVKDVGSDQEEDEGDEMVSRKYVGDSDDSVVSAPPNGGGWQRDPRRDRPYYRPKKVKRHPTHTGKPFSPIRARPWIGWTGY